MYNRLGILFKKHQHGIWFITVVITFFWLDNLLLKLINTISYLWNILIYNNFYNSTINSIDQARFFMLFIMMTILFFIILELINDYIIKNSRLNNTLKKALPIFLISFFIFYSVEVIESYNFKIKGDISTKINFFRYVIK